jgi:hypothetical protein
VYENRMRRRRFGAMSDDVTGSGENYIMRSLKIYIPYQILFG